MNIQPYLHFKGQCDEAFSLYEKVLGGKRQGSFKFGQSPIANTVPPEWHDKIMHTGLEVGSQLLLGSDAPPPHFHQPQGYAVCLECADEAEAERLYAALSEGAKISMPLAETFWAKRFAMFTDRFGTPWMINVSRPM